MHARSFSLPRSVVALAALLVASCSPAGNPAPAQTGTGGAATAAQSPAPAQNDGFMVAPGMPLLPTAGLAAAPRSVETVRAVYEFAASHPEVLDYVPCFCGCESAGHKANTHCFVGGRDSEGQVTQWDYHGLT